MDRTPICLVSRALVLAVAVMGVRCGTGEEAGRTAAVGGASGAGGSGSSGAGGTGATVGLGGTGGEDAAEIGGGGSSSPGGAGAGSGAIGGSGGGTDPGLGVGDPADRIVGVKIYSWDGAPTDDDALGRIAALGANTAFVDPVLAQDDGLRQRLGAAGLDVYVIVPVYFDEEALATDPGLCAVNHHGHCASESWLTMVCPTRDGYNQGKEDLVRHVASLSHVDGISLDFIRHYVFWENVGPEAGFEDLPHTCFDASCVARFQLEAGVEVPPTGDAAQNAAWILGNAFDAWAQWKADTITRMVTRLSGAARSANPSVKVNLHAVPWRSSDYDGAVRSVAGQDLAALGPHVDYVSPMTYAPMVGQPSTWVSEVVTDVAARSGRNTVPSIQVDGASVPEFEAALQEALKPPSMGVVFFSWGTLAADEQRYELARQHLDGFVP